MDIDDEVICKREIWDNIRRVRTGEPLTKPLRILNLFCEFKKEWDNQFDLVNENEIEQEKRDIKKAYYHRPERKEIMKKYYREYNHRPEVKARKKVYYLRPEVKEKIKARMKAYYNRPGIKKKRKEYNQRPEIKARQKTYYLRKKLNKT